MASIDPRSGLVGALILKLRNRTYRRLCEEEETDTNQDGIPDVYETAATRPEPA